MSIPSTPPRIDFAGFRARDLVDVLRAQSALLGAWIRVLVLQRGRLLRRRAIDEAAPSPEDLDCARRWARAVDRASRRGCFRPNCLTQSVALQRLLQANGVRGGRLHLGVRQDGPGFAAHAWVTVGDEVLREDPRAVVGFREFQDVQFRDVS